MSPVNSQGSPTKGNKITRGCLTPAFSGAQKMAEMPCHSCILGDPQQRGTKSQVAASTLPSRGPKRWRKCYVTPTFLGSRTKGEQNQKWLPHPCLLGGQKMAEMLRHAYVLRDPQQRGTESQVAASPLPSPGPKGGRKCYVTLAFSGVPNKGEQNQKWLPHPCLLRGPKGGHRCYVTPAFSGSPTKGNKITRGCLTPAFSGAQKRAEMLRHPYILRDHQQRGTKSQVAASPLPSRGPKEGGNAMSPLHSRGSPTKGNKIRSGCPTAAFSGSKGGQTCYITPAFSGIPNKEEQNHKWLLHPYLIEAKKRLEMLRHPCFLAGPQPHARGAKSEVDASPLPSPGPKRGQKCYVTREFSGIPNKGEQNHKQLPHPCLLGGPKEGGNATSHLHSRGSQTKGNKITSGCLTLAFSGAKKRAEMLRHSYILAGAQPQAL